jgi:hypothetical protein
MTRDREARLAQGTTMHSFCPTCRRVFYNINQHGPITPANHNRTFCVCGGPMTGVIKQKKTVYGLEDILGVEGAKKERARQKQANKDAKK